MNTEKFENQIEKVQLKIWGNPTRPLKEDRVTFNSRISRRLSKLLQHLSFYIDKPQNELLEEAICDIIKKYGLFRDKTLNEGVLSFMDEFINEVKTKKGPKTK